MIDDNTLDYVGSERRQPSNQNALWRVETSDGYDSDLLFFLLVVLEAAQGHHKQTNTQTDQKNLDSTLEDWLKPPPTHARTHTPLPLKYTNQKATKTHTHTTPVAQW